MEKVDDAELVVQRIAALDLGKAGPEADAGAARLRHDHRPTLEMVVWLRHWGTHNVSLV
jgi:hypothetical protein